MISQKKHAININLFKDVLQDGDFWYPENNQRIVFGKKYQGIKDADGFIAVTLELDKKGDLGPLSFHPQRFSEKMFEGKKINWNIANSLDHAKALEDVSSRGKSTELVNTIPHHAEKSSLDTEKNQKFSSASTSLNQVAAGLKMIDFAPGTTNLFPVVQTASRLIDNRLLFQQMLGNRPSKCVFAAVITGEMYPVGLCLHILPDVLRHDDSGSWSGLRAVSGDVRFFVPPETGLSMQIAKSRGKTMKKGATGSGIPTGNRHSKWPDKPFPPVICLLTDEPWDPVSWEKLKLKWGDEPESLLREEAQTSVKAKRRK